ncbi:MAG: hypothetical protein A2W31_05155 [Planctomycetes bacterium RBG_16_64_10]|nr:MAG: hypothetical protein A2W31_05155 [Planctomycetes bacterium RBG_16_64_10]
MVEGAQDVLLFEEHRPWAEDLAAALCAHRRIPEPDRRQHGRVGLWRAIKRRRSSDPAALKAHARRSIFGAIAEETTRNGLFGDSRKFKRAGIPVPRVQLGPRGGRERRETEQREGLFDNIPAPTTDDDPATIATDLVLSLPWDLRPFADAYWLRGLSESEVAQEMGCAPSTVSNRLYECVELLRASECVQREAK